MRNLTKGIIASLGAAAVITTGALIGVSANTAEPVDVQTHSPSVVSVEEVVAPEETSTPAPTVEPAPAVEEPAPEPAPEPAGPDLCPAGTQANSSDGYNDLSCMPTECASGQVPDPNRPQCDYFYEPSYYR
jgi:hypothetical protein